MRYVSIGDLAQTFQMRRHTTETQRTLARLTDEMATGQTADRSAAVRGDFTALAALERSAGMLKAYRDTSAEADLFVRTAQGALDAVQTIAGTLAPALVSSATTAGAAQISAAVADARQKLDTVVATLNVQTAGRYVFSGAATDARPMADGETLMAALQTAVASETTVSGLVSAVAAWFDAPSGGGGFLDTVYGGSASPAGPFAVGDGAAVAFGVTAADPGIRDTLEALSMAALVDGGAFAGQTAARSQITRLSGEALLSAEGRLTELRAGVGQVEAALASAAARIAAEDTATALARASILAADPYATATALTDAESRLETLYTLTARLSRLSFAEYLR